MDYRFFRNSSKFFRLIFLGIMLAALCFGANPIDAAAGAKKGCSKGIKENGTNGIYIDINAEPFKSFPSYNEGNYYAYKKGGCAWFASARAKQITDMDISTVWSGSSWWNTQYKNYGFERGQEIRPHSLACYDNHIVVVEAVDGDTVTVSESGYPSDAAHGHCVIRELDIKTVESDHNNSGKFYGYVYLKRALSAENIIGAWTGSYESLSNYETVSRKLDLIIYNADNSEFNGIASIDDNRKGSFYFRGNIDPDTGEISIWGTKWKYNPYYFSLTEFSGDYTEFVDKETISGLVDSNEGRSFSIRRK